MGNPITLLVGFMLIGLVWSLGGELSQAGEPLPSRHLQLKSDCLSMTVKPELIDSAIAAPEPMTLPDGTQSYTISIAVQGRAYGLCYKEATLRDAALASIEGRLVGSTP